MKKTIEIDILEEQELLDKEKELEIILGMKSTITFDAYILTPIAVDT